MKNYSLRELILVALFAGFLTAIIFNPFSAALATKASISGFFKNLPFLNKLFNAKQTTSTPQNLNLKPSKGVYKPTDYEAQIINAVKIASPAVVAITISKNVPIIEQCPYNPFSNLPPEFQQFFGQNLQFSQPCLKGTKLQEVGGGSGFIISDN
ncbi:MAG: hypothetical protein AAB789_00660, partial [Patescibacteria group bacterium]